MKLKVLRYITNDNVTLGLLFIDGVFECYTLEDPVRDVKIKHETCIPKGTYKVELRTVGGFNERYKKYDFHKGMLWVKDVPNFEYILIHVGNYTKNTSGCLLVGEGVRSNHIVNSVKAYSKMYKKVIKAFEKGDEVNIEYLEI